MYPPPQILHGFTLFVRMVLNTIGGAIAPPRLTVTMNLNTSRSGRKGGISKRKRCATQPVTAIIDPFSGQVTPATQHNPACNYFTIN